jgi:hypothetical protein
MTPVWPSQQVAQHDAAGFLARPLLEHLGAIGRAAREAERIAAIRGAEDRAAQVSDPAHGRRRQAQGPALGIHPGIEEAVVAVADAPHFPAALRAGQDHGADHGIEARRVAAAGADGDPADRVHAAQRGFFFFREPSM